MKFTNKRFKKGKLIISALSLIITLCICIPLVNNFIFADTNTNTILIDGVTYDLDNLEQYKTGTPTSGYDTATGIHYDLYETGLCVLTGKQTGEEGISNHPSWRNMDDIKIIYADYDCDELAQSFMFYSTTMYAFVTGPQYDSSNVEDFSDMFLDCSNLGKIDLTYIDTSSALYMLDMFNGCSNLKELDLKNFVTSNVTDTSNMFNGCSNLKELDLSSFDVSEVADMECMFSGCSSLQELDLSNFYTSLNEDMYQMFYECSSLEKLDISNFDTTNVTIMTEMFHNCSSLKEIDVSKFVTSGNKYFDQMFDGCRNLKEIDVSNFDLTSAIEIYGMFDNCTNLETIYFPHNSGINNPKVLFYANWDGGCTYGIARNCPNLKRIVIDNSFNGFGKVGSNVEGYDPSNYPTGGLFYTEKVGGVKVPLTFEVLGDYSSNDAIKNLGTASDPFYSYYEDDNRTIIVKEAPKVTFTSSIDSSNVINLVESTTYEPFYKYAVNSKVSLPICPWYIYGSDKVFTGWATKNDDETYNLIEGDTLDNISGNINVYAMFDLPKVTQKPTKSNGFILKTNMSPLWGLYTCPGALCNAFIGTITDSKGLSDYTFPFSTYDTDEDGVLVIDKDEDYYEADIYGFNIIKPSNKKIKITFVEGFDRVTSIKINEGDELLNDFSSSSDNSMIIDTSDYYDEEVLYDCLELELELNDDHTKDVKMKYEVEDCAVKQAVLDISTAKLGYQVDCTSLTDGNYAFIYFNSGTTCYTYVDDFVIDHNPSSGGSSHKKKTKETKTETKVEEPKEETKIEIQMYIGKNEALVNGTKKYLDTAPFIEDDRTFLPVRFISENLKANVSWDKVLRKVTVTNNDTTIILTIGSDIALVNDKEIKLDTKAFIKDDRTFIPIRFVSENLGCNVTFEKEQKEVSIKEKDN